MVGATFAVIIVMVIIMILSDLAAMAFKE